MGSGGGLEVVISAHREDPAYPNTCMCETQASPDFDEGHYASHLAAALAAHLQAVAGDVEVREVMRSEVCKALPSETGIVVKAPSAYHALAVETALADAAVTAYIKAVTG